MKLSDGTVIAVRQAPPEKIESLLWFFDYIHKQQAEDEIDRDAYVIRFTSAVQPYTSIDDVLVLRKILEANIADIQRIVFAILGRSNTKLPNTE